MSTFCPGYVKQPFKDLAANPPSDAVYPPSDFRTEWGPIFHRGRLDGTARILLLGQDPGQHENVLRRILVGEAGRRVQGFLRKLGITRRYVLLNALLYSVYGARGAKYVGRKAVADYRNRWIDGILGTGRIEAVVTFGGMAKTAWLKWKATPAGQASQVPVEHLTHPTFPESAGGTQAERAANMKKMLSQWSGALPRLGQAIQHPDIPPVLTPYGEAFLDADKAAIPSFDLPPGIPPWMYNDDGWARRVGTTPRKKRANITITVPGSVLP